MAVNHGSLKKKYYTETLGVRVENTKENIWAN